MDPNIEELLTFYVLDALTKEEKEQVEAYLARHPEAAAEVRRLEAEAAALPQAIPAVEPSPHVKEALMKRVASDVQLRRHSAAPRPTSRRADLFKFVSLGAALAAIVWAFFLNARVSELETGLSGLHEQVTSQSQSLERIINSLPESKNSEVITVALRGTEAQPHAHGQLIADATEQSAVLVVSGLPPLDPMETYQVWLIGDAPVSAGLLTVDENGQSVLIITSTAAIGSFQAVGISVEPQGGSPEPTGEIVVLSQL